MKKILLLCSITALLASCSIMIPPSYYYQVYKTTPVGNMTTQDDVLVYEDDHCRVYYNFWYNGGSMAFALENKTDSNLYLHLDKSFFVLNGMAHDYYKNRIFTSSENVSSGSSQSESLYGVAPPQYTPGYSSISNMLLTGMSIITNASVSSTELETSSSGYSVAFHEKPVICIPPGTLRVINEYKINTILHRSCNLYKYPSKRRIRAETFEKESSPFVFGNRIAYSVGASEELVRLANEFYVSEISNFPKSEIVKNKYFEYCGQQSSYPEMEYFTVESPEKFYIRYKKDDSDDGFEH